MWLSGKSSWQDWKVFSWKCLHFCTVSREKSMEHKSIESTSSEERVWELLISSINFSCFLFTSICVFHAKISLLKWSAADWSCARIVFGWLDKPSLWNRSMTSDLQHPAVKRVLFLYIKLDRGSHVFRNADSVKACLFWRYFAPTLLVAVTMACVTGIRSLASSKKSSVLKCFQFKGSPSYFAIDFPLL